MPVFSGDQWYRYGRGRGIDFFAADEELFEFLKDHLPEEFEPYSLLWKRSIPDGKNYRHEYLEDVVCRDQWT